MIRRVVALTAPVLIACSCNASYPTAPTADPTVIALQLHVQRGLGVAIVGSAYSFFAYTLRSDTAWEDVTSSAAWRSSNVAILRPGNMLGSFVAVAPGVASVLVRHGGFTQSIDVTVLAATPQHRPRLAISLGVEPRIGRNGSVNVTLFAPSGANTLATADAVWESYDPSVLTVERGVVRAIAPGTATITATYQGLSDAMLLSVPPPR